MYNPLPTQAPQGAVASNPAPPGVQAQVIPMQPAARNGLAPQLEVSIQRLEEIVDQETAALRQRKIVDLKTFNDRKSQALLELTRSLRTVTDVGSDPELIARVVSLRSKLAINQAVLKLHLEAVREISNTLSDAIRHSESDGTYTQAISSVRRS
jgi:hypothetical protein